MILTHWHFTILLLVVLFKVIIAFNLDVSNKSVINPGRDVKKGSYFSYSIAVNLPKDSRDQR